MGNQGRWCERKGEFKALKKEIKALNLVLIEVKRFLDTYFTTKNCFKALIPRLGYKFHHLINIKTHLNTTLIGLIRDKQVEISSNDTEAFKLNF